MPERWELGRGKGREGLRRRKPREMGRVKDTEVEWDGEKGREMGMFWHDRC